MKLRRMAVCVASALSLIGCANVAQQGASTSSYRFDYKMAQRADGVIRAFDDGRQAIVQFIDLEKSRPMFATASGTPIEYEIRGQYALLPSVFSHFTVKTSKGTASFDYAGSASAREGKPTVATAPAPIAAPAVTTPVPRPVATEAAAAVATPVTTSEVITRQPNRGAAVLAKKEEGRAVQPVNTEAVPSKAETQQQPAPVSTFAVLPSDTLLVPVLVRWAESGGLVPTFNGRQVTSKTLNDGPRVDLPLTVEARAVIGATAPEAIAAVLKTYTGYRTDVALGATLQSPNVLAITAEKPPMPQPEAATTQEKTWDAPARKAAGAHPEAWAINDSQSLRAVVERWAQQAGLRVEWESKHDFQMTDVVRAGVYSGTFKEALGQLASRFGRLSMPISMKFSSSGLVLRVTDANAS